MRLVAASCVGAGEFEEAPGERARLVHAADEEQGLAQLGEHECMEEHAASGGHALQHLVQEREGLRSAPGEGIRRTQDGGGQGKNSGMLAVWQSARPRSSMGIAVWSVPLAAGEQPNIPQRKRQY